MMTDVVADMLTRIRNAIMARHDDVEIPSSKLKLAIANILQEQGYIQKFRITKNEKGRDLINIVLKYDETGKSIITGLKRKSTPGGRYYEKSKKIPKSLGGYGIVIISTSKGIMTDKDCRKENIGGEVLCEVW
ncbi:MAG: 30S ribosomal protein S8 [Candidatus Schekmanbacteria bacterium]|nr:30S ribosomal protein S8 [Candidatus Schekmanbacteria bacterium]